MIYLRGRDGEDSKPRILVLETENLERLKAGQPIFTEDNQLVLAWTPDPDWLVDEILKCDGDVEAIGKKIKESTTRPQAPMRPKHGTKVYHLGNRNDN